MSVERDQILDDEPEPALLVSARAVRPRGPRASWVAAAWLSVIGAAIAIALLPGRRGQEQDVAARPSAVAAVASHATSDEPSARPAAGFLPYPLRIERPVQVIDLASPGPGAVRITSSELTVAGSLLVRAARVDIILAANGARLFGEASADVSDSDGGIRPAYPPRFEVHFDLVRPRPIGTMLVVLTAYDAAGAPIGGIRRAISIGPLGGG